MTRSPRRRTLALVAPALDVLAIALLLADLVAAYRRDPMGLVLFTLLAIPFAIAGSVTSGILLTRSIRRVPRWVLVIGVVVVTVATVPIGALALAIASTATPNPAADAEAIVGRTVEAAGGHRLCGSGDPGLGPDNTQPYYFALYELPTGVDPRPRIAARAQHLGWTVSADDEGDLDRTNPRLQIDQEGTADDGACGVYDRTERASAGMRLLQLEVLLPYR